MEKLFTSPAEVLPHWLLLIFSFVSAFGITFWAIPTIVKVANLKNLCASPNDRTSHYTEIPNLGGIAIFAGFLISSILVAGRSFTSELFYVIAGLIILFFVGIKDDILVLDPRKKLLAQVFVALLLAVCADIRIESFLQVFSIGYIPYFPGVLFSAFVFLVLINGFNLIDGIDGLASGAGLLASVIFGILFFSVGNMVYSVLCFSLGGALTAFFIFNVYGRRNRIFLGDTGSMIIGMSAGVFAVRFLHPDSVEASEGLITAAPAVVIGVLILPLFDTLRVFSIRIWQGKSPFSADRQHLHHKLLDLGLTHRQATFILLGANTLFVLFSLFMQEAGSVVLIMMMLAIAVVMSVALDRMAADHVRRQNLLEALLASYLRKLYSREVKHFRKSRQPSPERIRETAIMDN